MPWGQNLALYPDRTAPSISSVLILHQYLLITLNNTPLYWLTFLHSGNEVVEYDCGHEGKQYQFMKK